MKFKAFFAWYDFWVGAYYDRGRKILYVCPLPCIVLSFASNRNIWLNGKWKFQGPDRLSIVTPELFKKESIYVRGEEYKWASIRESFPYDPYPVGWYINTYSKVRPSTPKVNDNE